LFLLFSRYYVLGYPSATGNEMAVLQTATDEWLDKCRHWEQYCRELHYAYVNPVMVVQVQNGNGTKISATDLDDCLRKIEERRGKKFEEGEVVHTFGQTTGDVRMNGLAVRYEEPSRIADDMGIKVVFFKENLSTGWDCPRAETMVSFRHASDATYIAQLLGRMIRTPRGQRIQVDESLNNVWLFLPFFDERTLHDVVEQIQSADGAGLPTNVDSQQIGNKTVETLTVRTIQATQPAEHVKRPTAANASGQDMPGQGQDVSWKTDALFARQTPENTRASEDCPQTASGKTAYNEMPTPRQENTQPESAAAVAQTGIEAEKDKSAGTGCAAESIDREGIINAINAMGLQTYEVRTVKINDYLSSLFSMAHFLARSRIDTNALNKATQDVVRMIAKYVAGLKDAGRYEELAKKVTEYKLNVESLDVYGKALKVHQSTLFSTTDLDLDRQVRLADAKLAREGLPNRYAEVYYSDDDPNACKIDIILFTSDSAQMAALDNYAKTEFHRICDETRIKAIGLSPERRKKYDDIVTYGDLVTVHNFSLPMDILSIRDEGGTDWPDHLYVHPETREAIIKLNKWEADVIEEERRRPDYVCWVRNLSRSSWGLVVPYEMEGETKRAYPDFLVVRGNDTGGYTVDILEPHDPSRKDNLPKAKGFAKYAKSNPQVGRFQLIRQTSDASGVHYLRLDLTKSLVQEAVHKATTDEELTHIFTLYGVYED
jgi:type III restriction enzyme